MTKPFKPMLASPVDMGKLQFPVYASVKLDGIRCLGINGVAMSRTMKPIPNQYIQSFFKDGRYDGLDGELMVGPPNAEDVYHRTMSAVMSYGGEPKFEFHVFDAWDAAGGWVERLERVKQGGYGHMVLEHKLVSNLDQLNQFEEIALEMGYEGVMLRKADAPYKQGRSTAKEGYLLKLKRFVDAEFEIVGFEELLHNNNAAVIDELGHTKRSSHAENKVGGNTLGALVLKHGDTTFSCGTGYTAALRDELWGNRKLLIGKWAKIKSFPVGVKDVPRFPVFLGLRDEIDF